MKNKIYIFSPEITYKRFYNVWKKFPSGDIVPSTFIKGKIVWEMIRNKDIIVGIDPKEKDDPMFFATKLKKNDEIYLLR